MDPEIGPSPVWFGVLAIVSFAVLVIIAFASGYHLVADTPAAAAGDRADVAGEGTGEAPRDGAVRKRK